MDEPVCLVLGDNIFLLQDELYELRKIATKSLTDATILLRPVSDPERFGVAECDDTGKVLRLVENRGPRFKSRFRWALLLSRRRGAEGETT